MTEHEVGRGGYGAAMQRCSVRCVMYIHRTLCTPSERCTLHRTRPIFSKGMRIVRVWSERGLKDQRSHWARNARVPSTVQQRQDSRSPVTVPRPSGYGRKGGAPEKSPDGGYASTGGIISHEFGSIKPTTVTTRTERSSRCSLFLVRGKVEPS